MSESIIPPPSVSSTKSHASNYATHYTKYTQLLYKIYRGMFNDGLMSSGPPTAARNWVTMDCRVIANKMSPRSEGRGARPDATSALMTTWSNGNETLKRRFWYIML